MDTLRTELDEGGAGAGMVFDLPRRRPDNPTPACLNPGLPVQSRRRHVRNRHPPRGRSARLALGSPYHDGRAAAGGFCLSHLAVRTRAAVSSDGQYTDVQHTDIVSHGRFSQDECARIVVVGQGTGELESSDVFYEKKKVYGDRLSMVRSGFEGRTVHVTTSRFRFWQ
jgi:hypothetical protein